MWIHITSAMTNQARSLLLLSGKFSSFLVKSGILRGIPDIFRKFEKREGNLKQTGYSNISEWKWYKQNESNSRKISTSEVLARLHIGLLIFYIILMRQDFGTHKILNKIMSKLYVQHCSWYLINAARAILIGLENANLRKLVKLNCSKKVRKSEFDQ